MTVTLSNMSGSSSRGIPGTASVSRLRRDTVREAREDVAGRVMPDVPIYEYVCMSCESHFEELVGMSAPDPACPDCGNAKVAKQFSRRSRRTAPSGSPASVGWRLLRR